LQQSQMASLLMCDWLKKAQNLLMTGPCGTGKTYIACALGQQACPKGYSVRYYQLPRLILALTQAKADGSYSRLLKTIAGLNLLVIGDWGLEPLSAATRNDLMEIMDDRYEQSATGNRQPPLSVNYRLINGMKPLVIIPWPMPF
jgi:DNA replication protein DnaC